MPISYNKVILVGRTTRAPEMKMGQGTSKVANFTLAVDKGYEGKDETDFFNCVAFGKTAETISKYVGKGNLILVEGRLEIDKWESKDGINREKPRVVVSNFKFLETKRSREISENVIEEKVEESYDDSLFNDDEFEKLLNEDFKDD